MAKFKVNSVLDLRNSVWVLFGEIIDGEINPGDHIKLLLNEVNVFIKIRSTEYVDYVQKQSEVGLLIDLSNAVMMQDVGSIIGETVTVLPLAFIQ